MTPIDASAVNVKVGDHVVEVCCEECAELLREEGRGAPRKKQWDAPVDGTTGELEAWFRTFYADFNARDVEAVLAKMAPDVDWANGMTGGRVHGRDAVRAYWGAQWTEVDPRVEPVRISVDADGAVMVEVHQVVRDRRGVVLLDQMVRHVYRRRDGLVARMDIAT